MHLIVDIGNSNIVIALYKGQSLEHLYRYDSTGEQADQFYLHGIQEIFLEWGIHPSAIQQVGLSSVVPHLTDRLSSILKEVTTKEVFVMGPALFQEMDMEIPLPYEIGSDLVANAFAAKEKYKKNCIIVDFGTALTFTVYQHGKGIEGVTFAPGIRTALKALSGNTAQLPEADVELPKTVIGKDTQHAIQSGILYGYVGLVKEILSRIKDELDGEYAVIATGGMSSQLPLDAYLDTIDKSLTLDGIRLLQGQYARK